MVLLAKLVAEDTPAQYPKSAGIPASSLPPSLLVYPHPPTRLHQDLGSERFRGLSSWAEGVSLPIDFMCSSRTGAPRTGLRLGKLGRVLRSFSRAFRRRSESSVIRSSVDCICSRCSSICCSRLSMYCSHSSRSRKHAKLFPEHPTPPAPLLRPPEPLLYRTGALPTAAPCLSCG